MVTMSAFSVATALVTKDISSFAAIINGLNLPVLLLAGVLLPISLGPAWMRVLAHFNPLYYAVEGARALSAGVLPSPAVWQAFAVLVPLCVVVVTWATGCSAGPWPDRRGAVSPGRSSPPPSTRRYIAADERPAAQPSYL